MAALPRASNIAIIIPARYASTRYPGKPLAPLRGASGHPKSLIQRSWEAACRIVDTDRVWVATDDQRIADEVMGLGGSVVMTSPNCLNGTERCAEAVTQLGDVADYIVNLQGDAPLTPEFIVPALVETLATMPHIAMATPAIPCTPSLYTHLMGEQAENRVGGTTVVFNTSGKALYFSKRIVPHIPHQERAMEVHLHLGVYAYRPEALQAYASSPASKLEFLEGLEQLRFFDMDLPIQTVRVEPPPWDCIELNNPEDIPAIEAALRLRGLD